MGNYQAGCCVAVCSCCGNHVVDVGNCLVCCGNQLVDVCNYLVFGTNSLMLATIWFVVVTIWVMLTTINHLVCGGQALFGNYLVGVSHQLVGIENYLFGYWQLSDWLR